MAKGAEEFGLWICQGQRETVDWYCHAGEFVWLVLEKENNVLTLRQIPLKIYQKPQIIQ